MTKSRNLRLPDGMGGYEQLQLFLREVRLTAGCFDCGYNLDFRALQFDHTRGKKSFKIATAPSITSAIKELDKCDVRCANCHAIQTWERQQPEIIEENTSNTSGRVFYFRPYVCRVEGCTKEGHTGGMCRGHYEKARRRGTIDRKHECKICNREIDDKLSIAYCSDDCRKQGMTEMNKETSARRYASLQRFLRAVKDTCGCVNCEYNENVHALQFDHVGEKKVKVASANTIRYAVEELGKCEVRCANCHAIVTWERAQ